MLSYDKAVNESDKHERSLINVHLFNFNRINEQIRMSLEKV